eukprot:1159686-Pelagomonas_calceolata.AAC.9
MQATPAGLVPQAQTEVEEEQGSQQQQQQQQQQASGPRRVRRIDFKAFVSFCAFAFFDRLSTGRGKAGALRSMNAFVYAVHDRFVQGMACVLCSASALYDCQGYAVATRV